MKRVGRFFLLLVLLAVPAGAQVAPDPAFPLYDRYVVVDLNGQTFGAEASLTVKRRTADRALYAEGDAGCGWWVGAVEFGNKNAFRVMGIQNASSECPHAALERQFLAALKQVTRWRRDGSTLILEGNGVRLRLDPLPGANWI